ncbi:glycerophosphodiester phosphodiesterase family protein [Algibacillus agarilyticus]|uniref:glycerophosphodiester phosphodiesterase family protein n=1 Tax=Algibacillus agarilyticus TaxID=2234133 RepID=UPI000DD0DFF8|nr:glycerophosphodiester phosphodiesterase family protein [Algibacillus agarilyticus]
MYDFIINYVVSLMISAEFVAHRGDCSGHIENTLSSIRSTLMAGIRLIEIDVQLSKDGVPVLFHDRTLDRLTHTKGAVAELSLYELQQLRLYSTQESENEKTRHNFASIPTLDDVIALVLQYPSVRLFVEVKRINFLFFSYQYVMHQLLPCITPVSERTILLSFSYRFLRYCQHDTNYQLAYVLPNWSNLNAKMLNKLKPDYIFCNHELIPINYPFLNDQYIWVLYEITDLQALQHFYQRGVRYFESFDSVNLKKALQHAAL